MRLKFINASEIDKNAKCSIHKSGKLGFSGNAIKKLSLDSECSLQIGINESDNTDENLYVMVDRENTDGGFKIAKAGDYYYANTKALFDKLGIDYRNRTILYDIVDFEYDGMHMYKLIKRELVKKKQNALNLDGD